MQIYVDNCIADLASDKLNVHGGKHHRLDLPQVNVLFLMFGCSARSLWWANRRLAKDDLQCPARSFR